MEIEKLYPIHLQLNIPSGYSIEETVRNIIDFFASKGKLSQDVMLDVLDATITLPIGQRHVQKEFSTLKLEILKSIIDPDRVWKGSEMNVWIKSDSQIFVIKLSPEREIEEFHKVNHSKEIM